MVNYIGFSKKDESVVKAAVGNITILLNKACQQTAALTQKRPGKVPANVQKAFKTFWGSNSIMDVTTRLNLLKTAFYSKDFNINYHKNKPGKSTKAFVYVSDCATVMGGDYTPDIYLTDLLMSDFSSMGTNSALGTILHETSHLVLATDDHVYGMKSCSELTKGEKLTNADNYKYYLEIFQKVDCSMALVLSDSYDHDHMPPIA